MQAARPPALGGANEDAWRVSRNRWLGRVASVALGGALLWALFARVADLGEVVDVARDEVSLSDATIMVVLTAVSLAASFASMVASMPGLRWRDAAHVNLTTTAVAYGVPGGGAAGTALTVAMLRRLGFGADAIALEVLLTGAWNLAVKAGMPLVALAALAATGEQAGWLTAAGVTAALAVGFGGVLAWGFVWREQVAAVLGRAIQRARDRTRRLVRRDPVGDAEATLIRFRSEAGELLRRRGWALSAAAATYHLSLFGVLAVALAAVGTRGVSVLEALAVFAVVRQLSAVPITPGGVGLVELGMVGGLDLVGGSPRSAAAAVVLYRGLTYWVYLPGGPLLWAAWRFRTTPRAAPSDKMPMRFYRHPGDVVRFIAGLGIVAGLGLLAAGGRVVLLEADLFRLVNDLPASLTVPLEVVMQGGWLGAVPLASVAALVAHRRRLSIDLAAGGLGAWIAAKGIKEVFHRGRPASLLSDVVLRGVGEAGHGFVSGHAAVAAALATIAAGHVDRRVRRAAWTGVWAVAIARVYVGAHLPLDVIGGTALGWAIGGIVHLARGTPGHTPTPSSIAASLAASGHPVTDVAPVNADARGSIPYRATGPSGPLFIKAIGRDQRDGDLLYRLVRFLAFRDTGDEAPFATPKHQLEHEAYMAMLAARAGARVPEVIGTAEAGDGTWLAAQEHLDGETLSRLDPADITDELLSDLWEQIALLRHAGIAHRDLRAANIFVDREGLPWLVDWSFAETAATDRLLDIDVSELLAATACLVGTRRALGAAIGALGPATVAASARLLQPLSLSAGTRREVLSRPGLLDELHDALRDLGAAPANREQLVRLPLRPEVIGAAGLAIWALHHLVTRVASISELGDVLAGASWRWLAVAFLAAASGYFASACAQMAATPAHLALGRTLIVQLAASFASKFTPPGAGSATVTRCYLRSAGLAADAADSALARTRAAGLAVHAAWLTVAWVAVARTNARSGAIPGGRTGLIIIAVTLVVLGIPLWRPLQRLATVRGVLTELQALPDAAVSRIRGLVLLSASAGVTFARVTALTASLWAFGPSPSLTTTAAAYLLVAAAASLGPLPGGLGIVEGGLVVILTALGTPAGPAVAGVLVYRLITFVAPIAPGALAYHQLRCRGCC